MHRSHGYATESHDDIGLSRELRRVVAASFIGSTIEFYDFLLYTISAAIVFRHVFFANLSPQVGIIASFGTLAAGYVMRPLGGIVFGHFGDTKGRKDIFIVTLLLMGVSSTLIGLLPTYQSIGESAAVLLVVLRLIQGFAAGGDWGGAMTIAIEHAPQKIRGFAAAFANAGAPAGNLLASIFLAILTGVLPHEQFLAWGWRIPFLFSAVLVIVGLYIRLRIRESPLFIAFKKQASKRKRVPLFELLARSWPAVVVGLLVGISQMTLTSMAAVWGLHAATARGVMLSGALYALIAGGVTEFTMALVCGRLSDRYGRRLIIGCGIVLAALFAYPSVLLMTHGTLASYAVGSIGCRTIEGVILGPLAAFLGELFPVATRYTGASLTFQGSTTIGAGFTPMIAAAVAASSGGLSLLGGLWVAVLAVCFVALFFRIKQPSGAAMLPAG